MKTSPDRSSVNHRTPFRINSDSSSGQGVSTFPPLSSLSVSVTAQKLLNIGVVRVAQTLVSAAEDNLSVAHHQHFTVDKTKFFAFLFEHNFAGLVDHRIFGTQVMQVVHFMRDEDR